VAHWLTNRGKLLLMQGDWDDAAGGDYLVGLLVGASIPTAADTEAEVQDLNFVSELLALSGVSECTVSGYARQALTRSAASEDDTNNRVNMDASDLTFTALVTGQSIWGGFIFKTGASDAARALMSVFTLAAVVPTNGSNFTLTIADVVRAS
jgi:hypothetical protein